MSLLSKVGLGFMLALLAGLGAETYLIHKLDQKYAAQVESNKTLNDKLKETTDSLKKRNELAQITDQIMIETAIKIDNNKDKGKAIKDVVDQIAMRVANEKLTDSDADNEYVNSMWGAYCTGNESASGCSARLANSKL